MVAFYCYYHNLSQVFPFIIKFGIVPGTIKKKKVTL